MTPSNIANIAGAITQLIADELSDTLSRERAPAVSAAVLLLDKYPGSSVEALRGPLSLSHSGCVRLVDRLESEGFVQRRTADDARAVAIHLTRKGRELAVQAKSRREQTLLRTIGTLSAHEQETFARLATKVLDGNVQVPELALRTCRLCDYEACRVCPMHKFAPVDAVSD